MSHTSQKTSRDSVFTNRKIVGHEDLNPNGTLFGGKIMAWIDEVAFMSARRYSGVPFVVTVHVDSISFLTPLFLGDHVILTSQVNYTGRTSMEIEVRVEREDPYTGTRTQATSAYLTFVALDENRKPTPVPRLLLESPDDEHRHHEAHLRSKVRERMRRHLKSRKQRALPPLRANATLPEPAPIYILSKHLKRMGARELSASVDEHVLKVERTVRKRVKGVLGFKPSTEVAG